MYAYSIKNNFDDMFEKNKNKVIRYIENNRSINSGMSLNKFIHFENGHYKFINSTNIVSKNYGGLHFIDEYGYHIYLGYLSKLNDFIVDDHYKLLNIIRHRSISIHC